MKNKCSIPGTGISLLPGEVQLGSTLAAPGALGDWCRHRPSRLASLLAPLPKQHIGRRPIEFKFQNPQNYHNPTERKTLQGQGAWSRSFYTSGGGNVELHPGMASKSVWETTEHMLQQLKRLLCKRGCMTPAYSTLQILFTSRAIPAAPVDFRRWCPQRALNKCSPTFSQLSYSNFSVLC